MSAEPGDVGIDSGAVRRRSMNGQQIAKGVRAVGDWNCVTIPTELCRVADWNPDNWTTERGEIAEQQGSRQGGEGKELKGEHLPPPWSGLGCRCRCAACVSNWRSGFARDGIVNPAVAGGGVEWSGGPAHVRVKCLQEVIKQTRKGQLHVDRPSSSGG